MIVPRPANPRKRLRVVNLSGCRHLRRNRGWSRTRDVIFERRLKVDWLRVRDDRFIVSPDAECADAIDRLGTATEVAHTTAAFSAALSALVPDDDDGQPAAAVVSADIEPAPSPPSVAPFAPHAPPVRLCPRVHRGEALAG